ncbi:MULTISPECIES: universal stress protein [Legionella]|uniref:Universal stress protein n=1 Tax=Legionella maceachernii TaxID=466 RepID=A0A0W0W8V9_9GAMM|nr:universal stress protein [Legionella maceachernii]KTD28781.1 universal stress protein A [Legionella maceachernii]SJZ70785.1 Nucleotide-binding universal stress protein, UspA family [Legionella maceachernii]SUP02313.1 Universal stress protein A homolog 2 [Legionella maceachernii]
MYTTILHPTDLRENHFDMCKQALQIATSFNAKLHLLYVIEPPSTYQLAQGLGFAEIGVPAKEDAQTVMNYLGDALNIPAGQLHVEVGSAKKQIIDMITNLSCDLVIIGSHTPGAVPAFLGSTAYAVFHQAPCDVLTLRAREE